MKMFILCPGRRGHPLNQRKAASKLSLNLAIKTVTTAVTSKKSSFNYCFFVHLLGISNLHRGNRLNY